MPFQTANGTLILSPENHQYLRGVTPPEMLILHKMHFQNANGSPLGQDWTIQAEPAQTIDAPAKPAEEAYFDQNRGRHIEAKPPVPAKTHERTYMEEVDRLKKKYTGNITSEGVAKPAFIAVFGGGRVQLPRTFAEIASEVGIQFNQTGETADNTAAQRAFELGKLPRPQLCEMALALKLKIAANDSKDFIVAAIINAETKAAEAAKDPKKDE